MKVTMTALFCPLPVSLVQQEIGEHHPRHSTAQAETAFQQLCEEFLGGKNHAPNSNAQNFRDHELQGEVLQRFGQFLFRGRTDQTERLAELLRLLPADRSETPEAQRKALKVLNDSVGVATDTGLFDAMWDVTHPDVINKFCDAVEGMVKWTDPAANTSATPDNSAPA